MALTPYPHAGGCAPRPLDRGFASWRGGSDLAGLARVRRIDHATERRLRNLQKVGLGSTVLSPLAEFRALCHAYLRSGSRSVFRRNMVLGVLRAALGAAAMRLLELAPSVPRNFRLRLAFSGCGH